VPDMALLLGILQSLFCEKHEEKSTIYCEEY
jgi:hypothetical protein